MRINVIGTSGSGKTTVGRQLADILNIPFIEMDAIFWGPNWSAPEDKEFFPRLEKALKGDSWVLDGGYSRTTPIKWARVEAVVWIDYNFPRTLYQAITRVTRRLTTGKELWPGTGNRESLRMLFSKDSIVLWTITSYRRKRRNIIKMMEASEFEHIKFHRLRSPRETEAYLADVHLDPQSYKTDI